MFDINVLEQLRKSAIKGIVVSFFLGIIIVFVINYFFEIAGAPYTFNIIHYVIFVIIFARLLSKKKINEFKIAYKKTIVLEIFKNVFTDVTYKPNEGISESVIADTDMIVMGNKFYSNDYMMARYKNVFFEFSDVLIQDEYRDSDGNRRTETLFRGQWYIFDFNKKFKADIQVCEKDFSSARRLDFFPGNRFSKIELEDINFNKEFNVYAQNEIDAFYILTPNTMEKIKELNNKVHGSMLLCFIDNKLHIGLYNSKDLFEPSVFKKIDIERNHKDVKDDILLITQFVDILNLNNTLFRREV